jgi:hypothetical protein
MNSVWEMKYWGNTLLSYALVLLGMVLTWMVIRMVRTYLVRLLRRLFERTKNHYDDLVLCVTDQFVLPWVFV